MTAPLAESYPKGPASAARRIKHLAAELGFDQCGIAPARPALHGDAFRRWLSLGFHGDMGYMERAPHRRLDPREYMPGARSAIMVTLNYFTSIGGGPAPPQRAVFARYALNDDYHPIMLGRLRRMAQALPGIVGTNVRSRAFVDTAPVLERDLATQAGLGWFGKNSMLINTRRGSYFLIGGVLTDAALPYDAPTAGGCGTCTRCMQACPTGAIVEPYVVDARRCISYLTIEARGPIPRDLAPRLGNRVFGCDICQEVCPFNKHSASTHDPAFAARPSTDHPLLTDLLDLDEAGFRDAFRRSPVKRCRHEGLMRNARAANRNALAEHP